MNARLLLLAALAVVVPSAQAQDENHTGTWTIGFDQITMEERFSLSGQRAAATRQYIDREYGNGDGTLTLSEVEALERKFTGKFSRDEPGCFEEFGYLRLDGQGPVRLSEISFQTEGLVGATTSQAPADQLGSFTFHYREAGSDQRAATLNLSAKTAYFSSVKCYLGYTLGEETKGSTRSEGFVFRIRPLDGVEFLKDTVHPAGALQFWDGGGFRIETRPGESGDPPFEHLAFTVQREEPRVTLREGGYVAAAALGLVGAAVLLTELGRYKLLRLMFLIPGFTRVEKDEVLEHANREQLYNFIKSNPGPSFSDLRRSLELSNGTLVHHLRILEMQDYVKGERDGFRTLFYIRGPKIVTTTYVTRTQQQLLDAIRAHPGLTQTELSDVMGLPRQSLFYHTKQLAAQGKLEIKQDGNRRRYWLRGAAAPSMGGAEGPT